MNFNPFHKLVDIIWYKMFKDSKIHKTSYSCNELIKKAMIKRRRAAVSSIGIITNKGTTLRVIK